MGSRPDRRVQPSHRGISARKRLLFSALVAAGISSVWDPGAARAANQMPAGINLGLTSFFDGFGRSDAGFVYLTYAFYQVGHRINDNQGNEQTIFGKPKINDFVWINQLALFAPETLFGGAARPGLNVIWATIIAFDTDFSTASPAPGFQLQDNGVGTGDIAVGPFLQFKPIFAGGRPVFVHRIEFDVMAPIGSYDPHKDINQSANFASLAPYWALTVLPVHRLEISARLNYLYNFTNHRPANPFPVYPAVDSVKPGQAFWVNYAASFEVLDHVHLGVNGYYFRQLTFDRYTYVDGTSGDGPSNYVLGDQGNAKMLAIGPGVFWDATKTDKFFFNAYFSVKVTNRPQQNTFNLHYIHEF
jgi:hypothetical protein